MSNSATRPLSRTTIRSESIIVLIRCAIVMIVRSWKMLLRKVRWSSASVSTSTAAWEDVVSRCCRTEKGDFLQLPRPKQGCCWVSARPGREKPADAVLDSSWILNASVRYRRKDVNTNSSYRLPESVHRVGLPSKRRAPSISHGLL